MVGIVASGLGGKAKVVMRAWAAEIGKGLQYGLDLNPRIVFNRWPSFLNTPKHLGMLKTFFYINFLSVFP